jgi:hypothetical protein
MSKRPRYPLRVHTIRADTVIPAILATAPWIRIMQQAVPFSPEVCVAGSVGTWLAEYSLHHTKPSWDPNDIDVFIMVESQSEYETLCWDFMQNLFEILSSTETFWRTKSHRKYPHIIIVQYWIRRNGSEFVCPEFSLIHSPILRKPVTLMDTFDIDICKVSVHVHVGRLCFMAHSDVRCHILQRDLHCVMRKDPSQLNFHYPMQKTLARVSKYVQRGYRFKSLTFQPSDSDLMVADFADVWLPQALTDDSALCAPAAAVD